MGAHPARRIATQAPQVQQLACLLTNLVSACAIVFANKAVLSVVHFRFTVALTCIHTVATWLTARALCGLGIITRKPLPKRAVVSLAAAFTGYIVMCNVSLKLNTVGFYQLTKIAIAPVVLVMESMMHRRAPSPSVTMCVLVVCAGIGLATVFDTQVMTNVPGLVVGAISVVVSAQYGMWIGSITTQYNVTSMQLLEQYLPYASLMMAICVPCECALLLRSAAPSSAQPRATLAAAATYSTTLITFKYTRLAVSLIALSAVFGVLVTFSTFLVIGNTSPLTYAVAGHVKTIVILVGGVVFFGDRISMIKAIGLVLAMGGVLGYTRVKMVMSNALSGGGGDVVEREDGQEREELDTEREETLRRKQHDSIALFRDGVGRGADCRGDDGGDGNTTGGGVGWSGPAA